MSTHDTAEQTPGGPTSQANSDAAGRSGAAVDAGMEQAGKSLHEKGKDLPEVPDVTHMSAMDYEAHERTYSAFLRLIKWSVITIAVVLVLMAWFLT